MDIKDRENLAATDSQTATGEPEVSLEAEPQAVAIEENDRGDPVVLVERMAEAGEWPSPDLMEQIAAAGEGAVEPLLAMLRTRPRDWPERTTLQHAIGLVSVIRAPAAIPELALLFRSYSEEIGVDAAKAVGCFGALAFEPVFELCIDPALKGYRR